MPLGPHMDFAALVPEPGIRDCLPTRGALLAQIPGAWTSTQRKERVLANARGVLPILRAWTARHGHGTAVCRSPAENNARIIPTPDQRPGRGSCGSWCGASPASVPVRSAPVPRRLPQTRSGSGCSTVLHCDSSYDYSRTNAADCRPRCRATSSHMLAPRTASPPSPLLPARSRRTPTGC